MLAWLRCIIRRRHNPVRHPLGGFRCADCGIAGADFEEMGFDHGYVMPIRKTFSRDGAPIFTYDSYGQWR